MFKCKHCHRLVSIENEDPFLLNHREEWDNADTRAFCVCGVEYKVVMIDMTARREHEASIVAKRESNEEFRKQVNESH